VTVRGGVGGVRGDPTRPRCPQTTKPQKKPASSNPCTSSSTPCSLSSIPCTSSSSPLCHVVLRPLLRIVHLLQLGPMLTEGRLHLQLVFHGGVCQVRAVAVHLGFGAVGAVQAPVGVLNLWGEERMGVGEGERCEGEEDGDGKDKKIEYVCMCVCVCVRVCVCANVRWVPLASLASFFNRSYSGSPMRSCVLSERSALSCCRCSNTWRRGGREGGRAGGRRVGGRGRGSK
jgi:hypothetical protein